jgi:LuxR family transcriptional regulator, maltose regulon positive regulatory protein
MTAFVAGTTSTRARSRSSAASMRRPFLLERLVGSEVPLVVVSAPAGYGKTTLLRQWEANDGRPFAWAGVSAEDNNPDVLAEHVTRALLMAGVLGERRAKPSVTLAGRAVGAAQTDLAATLAISAPAVIVVDDAQELVEPRAHSFLERLLVQLPNGSKLAMVGRVKPAVRLARLRAEGLVLEIGPHDLALESREAARLVEAAGLRLSAQTTAALIEQAEGWPVGLALAAKSLQSRPDPESDALGFDGDDQALAEYLEEVVDGIGQQLTDFLIETSVLERFCAPLCDAVRQRNDSSHIIKALQKANMFIVPLDRTGDWHRYHHLFAAYLQAERRRRLGDNDGVLHARASKWWEKRKGQDGAVRHAYASGDLDRFEMLVWSAAPISLNADRIGELKEWLELPTPEQVMARPSIALAAAWLKLALNDGETGPLTAHLAGQPEDVILADGMPLRTALVLLIGASGRSGLTVALADATCAYDAIETRNPWKAFACLFVGRALRQLGRLPQAEAALREGHDRSAITMPALASSCLVEMAWLAIDEADWVEAQAATCRARSAFELSGAVHPVTRFAIDATSALVFARSGDTAAGHRHAQAALKEVPGGEAAAATSIEAQILLARALVLLSDHATARRLLGEARSQAAHIPEPGSLIARIVEAQGVVEAAFAASPVPDPLTPAEMRVLRYLPTYMTFEEIGRDLIVSRTTVKTQAIAVYRKLGVKSRAEAVRKAHQQGLLFA